MNIIDDILSRAGEARTITVEKLGHILTFRAPESYPEMVKLHREGQAFRKLWSNPGSCLGELRGLDTGGNEEAAHAAYIISETSLEPKISHVDALRLSRHAGALFAELVVEVVAPILGLKVEMEAEAVEEGKKPCGETPCDSCSCGRRETAGDAIPTN